MLYFSIKIRGKLLFVCCFVLVFCIYSCELETAQNYSNWETYRGTKDANQYSALQQINTSNVQNLEVAWTFQTGGHTNRSTIECNPIIIGNRMYVTSPDLRIVALNAATGEELWQFNPDEQNIMGGVNRGVTYWREGDDERILFTARHLLMAVNAKTGQLMKSFGTNGRVDLRQALGVSPENVTISATSPGIIFDDLIILGSAVGEGYDSSPGHIRAYNVKTGALVWTFHTIPQPGEFGYDTWEVEDINTFGGANAWGGLSLDEERALVYAGTGSVAFDFYGGNRKGENLFANCVLALDAKTGERVWHYQTVHHDLWDYDLPCAPNLVTIQVNGKSVDAVAQPTKMGYLFLLNRETGEPLYPVEERSVPPSTIPGEEAWSTQPFPTFPYSFTQAGFSEQIFTTISDSSWNYVAEKYKQFRGGTPFLPPSTEGSLAMPGTRGGAEWSGASFDPETGILYINANEIANILRLKEVEVASPKLAQNQSLKIQTGKSLYQLNCTTCHGLELEGAMPTYPPLANLEEKYKPAEIATLIQNGKGTMPAFGQFSKEELEAIAQFLLTAKEADEEKIEMQTTTRYVVDGYRQFRDQEGYPANKPPWGTLNAVNLNTGELEWKVPLGEFSELTKRGIPPTGTQNMGGCVATAGGLVFIGAAKDEKFRAFDKVTGEILWEYQLPAGGYATPAVYAVDGKQYVVIAAGGGGKNATKSGDSYIAFRLPD